MIEDKTRARYILSGRVDTLSLCIIMGLDEVCLVKPYGSC